MAYIGRDPQYGAFEKQSLTADSSTYPSVAGQAGTANTGGGGGGGGSGNNHPTRTPAGLGGKGIVIIRYKFQN